MKNTQTFKIIMLSTEKAEDCLYTSSGKLNYHRGYLTQDYIKNSLNGKSFHLYIISDEEIKENDYCYISHLNIIRQNVYGEISSTIGTNSYLKDNCKKVIATTDKFLDIPLIPYSFLPPFIKVWNENNKITEVNLEMCGGANDKFIQIEYKKIKLREDNTVIILETKKYSKEEVINLFNKMYDSIICNKTLEPFFQEWIKENL